MIITERRVATDAPDVSVVGGRLLLSVGDSRREITARWLLDRSDDAADVDPVTNQRLFEPNDVRSDLLVETVDRVGGGVIRIEFCDGRRRSYAVDDVISWTDVEAVADRLPARQTWLQLDAVPSITWTDTDDDASLHRVLDDFHRVGCFVIVGAPTKRGSLHQIAGRFGRVSPTTFGALFDVESILEPTDLAYTPVGLGCHTDQPYRRPVPGLQFLHALVNDAPGGESIITDGLGALEALRILDPGGFVLLVETEIEYRYDIGTDVVVDRAPAVELHRDASIRQFRFSPRLDVIPWMADPDVLDRYHDVRRWLADWFADPDHQLRFKMRRGDVLVVDNHRVLHGRTPFDPAGGRRHLQGCYIDHDGPATLWRLLTRRMTS